VTSFREFIEQHKDEITALQVLYSRPYKQRLTYGRDQGTGGGDTQTASGLDARRAFGALTETLDRSRVKAKHRFRLRRGTGPAKPASGESAPELFTRDLSSSRKRAKARRASRPDAGFAYRRRQFLDLGIGQALLVRPAVEPVTR